MANGETLQEAEVTLIETRGEAPHREIVVRDHHKAATHSLGVYELWAEKADCPSYHLLHEGTRWEFVRSAESPQAL